MYCLYSNEYIQFSAKSVRGSEQLNLMKFFAKTFFTRNNNNNNNYVYKNYAETNTKKKNERNLY